MTDACYRARRILTMDPAQPEIHDAGILVLSGRIAAIGPWARVHGDAPVRDLGAVTLAPGLINAHAHLGLSHLAGRIPAGLGFPAWADALFGLLGQSLDEAALIRAVEGMRAGGSCFVADVVGPGGEIIRQALDAVGLDGLLFRECAGRMRGADFEPRPLPGVWSAGVHALYSTADDLARAVKAWCAARALPFTIHLAEVPGENELFRTGRGPFAEFLRARRILPKGFAPSARTAVAQAQALGLLDARTLAVHCVQAEAEDVDILARSGATVCLCPRSNSWIGVGQAPAVALFEAGVPLCLGTDSLASAPDLDLWTELRAVRGILPALPLSDLLAMVTTTPARILGISAEYGSLAPGKRAVWAVVPEDLADAECIGPPPDIRRRTVVEIRSGISSGGR